MTDSTKTPVDLPKWFFFGIAGITASFVFLIIGFLIYVAAPVLATSGIGFILNNAWDYDTHQYGIAIFIIDTIILTLMALLIAVPSGIFTAIFLAEWAPAWLEQIIRPCIELLVGIPSVVYGLFGIFIFGRILSSNVYPLISSTLGSFIPFFYADEYSVRTGFLLTAIILAVMILPTIIVLSQDAIRSVPHEYREASLALGATRWETIKNVIIPVASAGIVTSIVLAMMRAMGETMAVVMLLGNIPQIPATIFDSGYVMTSKILLDIGYRMAEPEARSALFGIGVVIFVMEFFAVALVRLIALQLREE
jgi:phosphate transport system permease protein